MKRIATIGIVAGAMCCAHAPADVTFTQEDRFVTSWVHVPVCEQPMEFDSHTATPNAPFDSEALVELECDGASATGMASQQSQIALPVTTAFGSFTVEAGATDAIVIHSFGRSEFDVSFQVDSPMPFTLIGEMTAERFGMPAIGAASVVRLTGPSGAIFADESLSAPLDESVSSTFEIAGELEPGTYRLFARADGLIDGGFGGPYAPEADGGASFDFTFTLGVLGDLNNDGVVDVFDLLILLAAWGECPPFGFFCPDLNGDGVVDVFDLLILLANWS